MDKGNIMVIEHAGKKDVCYLLAILLLTYFFFFINLGGYSLKEPDEGRYAEIPREMVEQGDYLVPHLNYVRYFEKPPLLYWATAVSYKLFGISEWSFRFPNALVAFFCSVLLFYFGRKWFSRETGFFGAVVLISCVGFFAMARTVTIDMLLTGFLFTAVVCFNEFYRERRSSYLYLFYASLAMATLAKGPVAPVLVGLSVLVFLYTEKDLSFLRILFNIRGLLLYAVIAAPWFVVISIKEKEFFQFFFIDQNILRFLTEKHRRSGPVYYFIPVLVAGMLPWSFFLPRAVMRAWRMKDLRFLIIYSVVVFLFSVCPVRNCPLISSLCSPLFPWLWATFLSPAGGRSFRSKKRLLFTSSFLPVSW
jgi:4-amino-4-deoxy-L-arabinose transferase-like glycosyltransferase